MKNPEPFTYVHQVKAHTPQCECAPLWVALIHLVCFPPKAGKHGSIG